MGLTQALRNLISSKPLLVQRSLWTLRATEVGTTTGVFYTPDLRLQNEARSSVLPPLAGTLSRHRDIGAQAGTGQNTPQAAVLRTRV